MLRIVQISLCKLPFCFRSNGSCEGELERFEGDETKYKIQPQDSRMREEIDFKQMSEEESFTRQNNDMIAKKPAFAKQESFARFVFHYFTFKVSLKKVCHLSPFNILKFWYNSSRLRATQSMFKMLFV